MDSFRLSNAFSVSDFCSIKLFLSSLYTCVALLYLVADRRSGVVAPHNSSCEAFAVYMTPVRIVLYVLPFLSVTTAISPGSTEGSPCTFTVIGLNVRPLTFFPTNSATVDPFPSWINLFSSIFRTYPSVPYVYSTFVSESDAVSSITLTPVTTTSSVPIVPV